MVLLGTVTIFSILGILQSASAGNENINLEIGNIEIKVKCYEGLRTLIEAHPRYISFLNDELYFKDEIMQKIQIIITSRNKCTCGKETEDSKCQDEFLDAFVSLIKALNLHNSVYKGPVIETMSNVTKEAIFTLNELGCCSKKYPCVEKLDFPYAKYKDPIKECKPEANNSELCRFMSICVEYLEKIAGCRMLQDQCMNAYENLVKAKDEIPTEEKCKEDIAASLAQKLQTLLLCFSQLASTQTTLNEDYDPIILLSAETTMTQLVVHSREKLKEKISIQ